MEVNLIHVEPSQVYFPNTYISSTTRYTVKIVNNSDKTLHYKWMRTGNESEDQQLLSTLDDYDANDRNKRAHILEFAHPAYVVEPMSGEVWANRDQLIVFEFSPQVADEYTTMAYLYDDVTNSRHKILLKGNGLPPDARFNIDSLNVGHVPLESVFDYDIVLSNDGQVVIDYELTKKDRGGFIFKFSPPKGRILVGESQNIRVRFIAAAVGQFNETFEFAVRGALRFHPVIHIYGKVVGPDFVLSTKMLNFGDVSYGFLYSQSFEIENKSEIPFDFSIRCEQDNSFSPHEFNLIPTQGTVPKFGKFTVTVEFVPIVVQKYDVKLAIDIIKVGKGLEHINVLANCLVPSLRLKKQTIEFDKVFYGYEYSKKIVIISDSDFPAKFEFSLPEESTVAQASLSVSKLRGVVGNLQELPIDIYMRPQVLGPIKIPCFVKAAGSDNPPIPFTVAALCTGPNLIFSTQNINYGNITVLKNSRHKVTVTNDSLIPANYEATIQADSNVFSVEPNKGVINPKEVLTLEIIANLDDTIKFSGKVVFSCQHLNPMYIDLTATGIGTPIQPSIQMSSIDFNYILNEQKFKVPFTITNRGRRTQEIRWTVPKPKVEPESAAATFSFKVIPEQVIIESHQTVDYYFVTFSTVPCTFNVTLQCNGTIGRSRVDLFQPICKGIVIKPLLSFSRQLIDFIHHHDSAAEEEISNGSSVPSKSLMPTQDSSLTITNLVQLPLNISIDCPIPFKCEPNVLSLESKAKTDIRIIFEPSFKEDFGSELLNRKLTFNFEDHPQKQIVNLKAQLIFPNLSFTPSANLAFGNLLLNTEQTKEVQIKATSDAEVDWSWQLVCDDETCDICRIFDVYPIRGHTNPDETDNVHFSFFAYGGENGRSAKYSATAICHIVGGPDYLINLTGAAAAINYKVTPAKIEFGYRRFDEQLTTQIVIQNLSDVSINYSTKISKQTQFDHFTVTPQEGVIQVDGSATLTVSITSGLPKDYQESLLIQIGHFEEIKIPISVSSHFPQVKLNLPRHVSDPAKQNAQPNETDLIEVEKRLMIEKLSDKLLSLTGTFQPKRRRFQQDDDTFTGNIIAKYYFDVGNITIGEIRSFDFNIESKTPFPISIEPMTNLLKGTGFTIDPVSISQMPPNSEVPMKINFDTALRTSTATGNQTFEVIFKFTDDLAFAIVLKSKLILPNLAFSKNHFEFEEVIVGQSKVMTLQLQNMNSVSCEFSFGDPQPLMTKSMTIKKDLADIDNIPKVFFTNPTNGTLPAAAFQNIELSFIPIMGKVYSMQIPINVKYNNQPRFITVSGTGVQLRVEFDPPNLNVPPVEPFSEASQVEVQMINPTNYPIEVFSYYFDFDLFVENFKKKEEENEESNVTFAQTTVSKFSICVVVHGPKMSGRSTVSNLIADHLHVPVINLKEIWGELIEKENTASADFTAAFFSRISQPDCAEGFVIDSLDVFKEPHETDQFIVQSLKAKNLVDDTINNPFNAIPHANPTAAEQALQFIINGLDGHYIFFVGVRATQELVEERITILKNEEHKKKREEQQQEKDQLFNMTEEEYNALDEEKRTEIDEKRKAFRKRLVRTAMEPPKEEKPRAHHRKSSSRGSADKSDDKDKSSGRHSKHKHRSKDEKPEASPAAQPPPPPPKKRKAVVPTDPNEYSILLFNLIVGSLAAQIHDSCDNFQAIDPTTLQKAKVIEITEEEEEETQAEVTMRAITQLNSMILEIGITVDEEQMTIDHFIPKLQDIKGAAFTDLIPTARIEKTNDSPHPKTKYDCSPPYFSILNEEPLPELPDLEPEDIKPKRGRGSVGSRAVNIRSKKKPTNPVTSFHFDVTKLTPKWQLEPNSRIPITIRFDPTSIGSYRSDLLFGLSNCKCDIFKLPVNGTCSHPDISRDPKVLFNKIVNHADMKTEFSYVNDINEFQFGPVLIGKDKVNKAANALYNEKIHIKNVSMFPVQLTAVFSEPKNMWYVEPGTAVVQPEETLDLTISVHPTTVEIHKNTLSLSVQDQPEPLSLEFSVEGCVPSIDASASNMDFGKLLLEQKRTLTLDLKNTSRLPSFWRIKNAQALSPSIEFNALEGLINPRQGFSIKATFTSAKPINIKKAITLEVLDKLKQKVYQTTNINVTAESFDVVFDFQYPKGLDHLQYGALKVLQAKSIPCTIKNKGKFPIHYKLLLDSAAQQLFTITPMDGTLGSNEKPLTLNFTLKTPKVVKIANAKGIVLMINDPTTNTNTAQLPIPYSCNSMYSCFSITPSRKIDFGAIPINQLISKQITLKNEGQFPFEYEITGTDDDPPPLLNPRDKKKLPPPPKPRGKKAGNHVAVGNYGIQPSSGSLVPNASAVIDMDFQWPLPGRYRATLRFKITDSEPNQNDDSTTVKLQIVNIVPGIVMNDFEHIFPGLMLCLRYDLNRMNRTSFLEDEQVLHFEPMILQRRSSVEMALINKNPIPCSVDLSIKPKTKAGNSNFPFDLSEKTVNIEPESTHSITIGFNPVTCDSFQGFFEAVVKGQQKTDVPLKFTIEGIGTLPAINIPQGMDHGKGSAFTSNMGRTLLGFSKEKTVRLVNEGVISASITLNPKLNPDFEILAPENFQNVIIPPSRSQNVTICFKPQKPRKSQLDIGVTVADNPKASISLSFTAEGSAEDIIFEGLSNDDGDLIFKDCVVGRQIQNTFTIKNVGCNDVRFAWAPQHDLVFVPRVGHLKMEKSKEISVSFFADHPVKQGVLKVTCQIQKIEMANENAPDWDDSMKVVKFVPKSSLNPEPAPPPAPVDIKDSNSSRQKNKPVRKGNAKDKAAPPPPPPKLPTPPPEPADSSEDEQVRVIEVLPEPMNTVIPGKGKELSLRAQVVADYIRYQIDVTEIAFSPTMMYQTRVCEARVTNVCQIRFEYQWRVYKFESLRTDYATTRPPPFSVEPATGYIEPGQATVFKVKFCPEEVDDFTALLRCDIPFMTQMEPPIIALSGLSRRPLCHFNIELSDYLTRRHPDYNTKLPDEIKVIELFSKAVGVKTTKRFEVINPTASAYEIKWAYIGEGETPIATDTPSSLLSSGKRSMMSFTYLPTSVKTVESRWEFQIPEHSVRVQFLFVGRIMP